MKNIATCYSEHAVKVSDSYCSGPLNKSYISPKSTPFIPNVVTCTYKTLISNQKKVFITITWCSKLICQGFFIKISEKNPRENRYFQHGFHQLPKIRGSKNLQDFSSDHKLSVSVHWDLTSAHFEAGPKPVRGFYLALVIDSTHSVLLGDMEDDVSLRNYVGGTTLSTLALVSQCEHYRGESSSSGSNNEVKTKAKFSGAGEEHELVIKCCPEDDGPRSPVLSVYIDKKRVVRIKRLHWNFRGNHVIFVDGLLVDVMWDVHGWYYFDQTQPKTVGRSNNNNNNHNIHMNNKRGCGYIMFRTRSGLDSRLWLEEEERKLADKNHEFSLLICASATN